MKILERDGNLVVCGVTDLDLAQTLDCGQCFRWEELPDGSFFGVALNRPCHLAMEGEELTFYNCPREEDDAYWEPYFDLGTDYTAVKEALCLDPVLKKAIDFAPGIRVLRQPFFETLCTFLISQNNNIARIRGIVERLCALAGEPVAYGRFSFPDPARLAGFSLQELAPLRAGWRSAYLLNAAQQVALGQISEEELRALPLEQARLRLQSLRGVGPKVADCVLLFGLGRWQAFPRDVWINRAMDTLFPRGIPVCCRSQAGIAQQYIFAYARAHLPRGGEKREKKKPD